MLLMPTSSGTSALHEAVPEATPLRPAAALQVTSATPEASRALPASRMLAPEVALPVEAGEWMTSDGAVVSPETGVPGGRG